MIMDKEDYIQEGLRQLSDHNFYEPLENDPTQSYNNQIYLLPHQASHLNIIDEKIKKHYTTRIQESQTSICYQKYISQIFLVDQ